MAKYAATGTSLRYEDPGSPGTFVAVAQVQGISGPTLSAEEIDVTTHDTTGEYREFLGGFKDGGEITFTVVFDPEAGGHPTLLGFFDTRELLTWRIVFPTDTVDANKANMEFSGFVRDFQVDAQVGEALTAEVTIRVSGQVTLNDTDA